MLLPDLLAEYRPLMQLANHPVHGRYSLVRTWALTLSYLYGDNSAAFLGEIAAIKNSHLQLTYLLSKEMCRRQKSSPKSDAEKRAHRAKARVMAFFASLLLNDALVEVRLTQQRGLGIFAKQDIVVDPDQYLAVPGIGVEIDTLNNQDSEEVPGPSSITDAEDGRKFYLIGPLSLINHECQCSMQIDGSFSVESVMACDEQLRSLICKESLPSNYWQQWSRTDRRCFFMLRNCGREQHVIRKGEQILVDYLLKPSEKQPGMLQFPAGDKHCMCRQCCGSAASKSDGQWGDEDDMERVVCEEVDDEVADPTYMEQLQ